MYKMMISLVVLFTTISAMAEQPPVVPAKNPESTKISQPAPARPEPIRQSDAKPVLTPAPGQTAKTEPAKTVPAKTESPVVPPVTKPSDSASILARRRTRWGGINTDCVYWSSGVMTIDREYNGQKARVSYAVSLENDKQRDSFNKDLDVAIGSPWVRHSSLEPKDNNDWTTIFQIKNTVVSASWGAIWWGERDSDSTTNVLTFMRNNCGQ